MTRVLLIGIAPEFVDPADPDTPSSATPERIAAGINTSLSDMRTRGWEAAFCAIRPDDSAEETIAASLVKLWDCVVIGAGVRVPKNQFRLFERVINAVHQHAPSAMIAFNQSPEDSADAAARCLNMAHRSK